GLTGGLVGGSSGTSGTSAAGVAGSQAGTGFDKLPQEDRAGLGRGTPSTSTATTRKAPGPTSGQANVTNTLLRQILPQVQRTNRGHEHPEAHHQRRVGAAVGDYATGATHGM